MKILFAGGGTLGPVTPLLAVADEIRRRKPDAECAFVGTPDGPERRLVEEAGMRFLPLAAPKLRRYFSLETLALPFDLAVSVWKAGGILAAEKPDAVVGAGGYVQVPIMLAARLRGVKTVVHQQDVVPSLSNKLVAGGASAITVTFESSLADFPKGKTRVVGNPVRREVEEGSREKGLAALGLSGERPVILTFGGGTGSA
ncbi:MAG TPA: glycosyltransferase, partial [Patescibacteria group bacterium]|nr:glycosyltransferase [Patescibacteria group bacterium]